MEESTEVNMETDVSSTIEDVSETQEVTGSDGNVEMIIVVEKMEEEQSANDQREDQPSLLDESTGIVTTSGQNVPQKDTQAQKSPVKSPIKVTEAPNSPSKREIEQVVVVVLESEPEQHTKVQASVEIEEVEAADSSVKEPLPTKSDKQIPSQNSPEKEAQKSVQKTPVILSMQEESLQEDSSKSTPTKECFLNEKSPVNGKVQCKDTSSKTVTNLVPIDINIERDASNDSQVEIMSDTSEKEHNKSISRELKSLIKSAKESKIINECTQLTSKTRKSRAALETSSTSLNSSLLEPNKIDARRNSDNSQKSNCSEKSDKTPLKRSMRSQNPEFVSKVKQFLNSVTGKGHKDTEEEDEELVETVSKNKIELNVSPCRASPPKIKKTEQMVIEKGNKLRSDTYCWRCHWVVEQATNETKVHPPMHCTVCPRSFHYKCLSGSERNKINLEKNWVCPECMIVLQAESSETRSQAMKKISLGMLCDLLKHALERMMDLNGVEPFMQPVDRAAFPDYDKYVVHPMDLSLMRDNITEGLYGSTEAFLADAQWILHNSIIFNTLQSKLTAGARALVRSCRAEMGEIEACPECYAAAHARRPTWFTDVCSTPHILFWAKLKGFPYWPAKGMSVNSAGHVDVRFFGAHDRAWVPAKDCFLYSEKDPNNFRTKRQDILDSMQEAEQHIRNISRKYGRFVYPPFKTQFDPTRLNEQLKMMIPEFEGEVRSLVKDKNSPTAAKEKSRSNSKSSKSSFNDGDISENEDTPTTFRKMADGAEIAKMEDDDSIIEKIDNIIEGDTLLNKIKEDSISLSSTSASTPRKRRRSELDEAIITIIETSGNSISSFLEKRKRLAEETSVYKSPDLQEPSSSKEPGDKPQLTTDKHKEDKTMESIDKSAATSSNVKGNDLAHSTEKDKNQRVTPIRIALVTKDKRHTRNSLSKEPTAKIITPSKDTEKSTLPKQKSSKSDKLEKPSSSKTEKVDKPSSSKAEKTSVTKTDKVEKTSERIREREEKSKSVKRRNSKSNRSLNSSFTRSDKTTEKKSDKTSEPNKNNDNENSSSSNTEKEVESDNSRMEIQISPIVITETHSPKSVKDRLQFDDDTTLAVIARETGNSVITLNPSGLPTISCVRSLSTTAHNTGTSTTSSTSNIKTIDITVEASSDSSIFTPTSMENVKTMKDAVTKLQRLRNDAEPVVGRVGVRAFARMTSPDKQKKDDVQVEIKAEPIDLDEPERHMEKMDLMNAFRLRPVNPNPPSNLREVRINKVVVTPLNARKTVTKAPEVRPRAKKTFPQPKKPEDGRSELNCKNSMVYIPIQPPMTQAPVRLPRPPNVTPAPRPLVTFTSSANNLVNTVTTPLMQASSSSPPTTSTAVTTSTSVASVPTVHTVPLMTSVNGQWMFSFQPVMSVGAIDSAPSPPMMNGVSERGSTCGPPVPPPAATGAPPASPATTSMVTQSVIQLTVAPNRTPTENSPGEPPRLQQRPTLLNPLDASTPIGKLPTPSTAGPVTAKLNQNAVKLTDFFRTLLEDSLEKLDEPVSQLTNLRLKLEQAQWRHKQEMEEVKHNHELTIAEMRASFEKEKLRLVSEARRAGQVELETAVKQAKAKQWCANCCQEAQFYCCWNTSYCDYACQRAHWAQHFSLCQQRKLDGSNGEMPKSPENRLQPQPDLPKSSCAPTLTVGGKQATRVFAQDQHSTQKASIIVSMVEDTAGNQTMKCLGTYKPPTPAQMAPIIINKQIMNNEENANKKVVSSSGGYLIVGGGASSSGAVPSARRTHAIQYYT